MRMSGQRRLARMTKEQEVPASDADNIPGLTMLGYGYDVFAAPYCDADHCNGEGSEPLLDLGAETSTEITAFGRKFRHPNRVQVLNEQPKSEDYTIFGRTAEEYNSQLNVKASLGGSYGAFSGSIEASYSGSSTSRFENVYAEHGHVYSGITVRVPHNSASTLRSYLKPAVKKRLEELEPDEVIRQYGTHLVAAVVIGGKAFLHQYSSRSDVSDSSEWKVAVQAKYMQVTASGSVDSKYDSHISKFQMSNTVKTTGGSNALVQTSADMQAWLNTIDQTPAVIDMTVLVPLWQLLEPGAKRDGVKAAVLRRAKRFQAGALCGSVQAFNNDRTSADWTEGTLWGSKTGRNFWIAQAQSYSDYGIGQSALQLFLSTGMEARNPGGYAIYGGRQQQSDDRSLAPWKEISKWGVDKGGKGNVQEVTLFSVYTDADASKGYSNGMSKISLYVGPIDEVQENDRAWVVLADDVDQQKQEIATGKMWTGGGWNPRSIYLNLQQPQFDLNEIAE